MKNDGFTFRKRMKSFRYAFRGIYLLVRYEHNAWIHCAITACVLAAGFLAGLSRIEWVAIVLCIGMVLKPSIPPSRRLPTGYLQHTMKPSGGPKTWPLEPY